MVYVLWCVHAHWSSFARFEFPEVLLRWPTDAIPSQRHCARRLPNGEDYINLSCKLVFGHMIIIPSCLLLTNQRWTNVGPPCRHHTSDISSNLTTTAHLLDCSANLHKVVYDRDGQVNEHECGQHKNKIGHVGFSSRRLEDQIMDQVPLVTNTNLWNSEPF